MRGKKTPFRKTSGRIEKIGGRKRTSRTASQSGSGFDASCFRPFESESFRCSERIGFGKEGSSGKDEEDKENDIESSSFQKLHCSHQEIPA